MTTKKTLITATVATIAALGLSLASGQPVKADKDKMEKCYGISKASMNDCGAKGHSCSGQAKTDSAPNEWIFVPKGTCDKIVGGSLKTGDEKAQS